MLSRAGDPTPTCLDCDRCLGYSCLQTLVLRGSTVRHWVRLPRSCIGQKRENAGASGNNMSTKKGGKYGQDA